MKYIEQLAQLCLIQSVLSITASIIIISILIFVGIKYCGVGEILDKNWTGLRNYKVTLTHDDTGQFAAHGIFIVFLMGVIFIIGIDLFDMEWFKIIYFKDVWISEHLK